MIAGHTFNSLTGRCDCGRRWADILGTQHSDVGQDNISHSGTLAVFEYDQIVAERDRIAKVTMDVARAK